jgi:glutamate-1-semialdehyde 2,1-aminomutase
MRAVLDEVLTDESFGPMEELATLFAHDVRDAIITHDLPWSVSQLGARCEYRFASPAPTTGGASMRSADALLEEYLHLCCVNRGVLLTPFHNMALMSPATTLSQVQRHGVVFNEALDELVR